MDNSNKQRMKALNELKLSSIAYLEARDRHGESGAVAACTDSFNQYHNTASKNIAAAPKARHIPKSGLNANDLDDFFKKPASCAGKYEACKASEVNDSDVRALVNKRQPQLPAMPQGSNRFSLPKSSKAFEQSVPRSGSLLKNIRPQQSPVIPRSSEIPQTSISKQVIEPKTGAHSKSGLLEKINRTLSKRNSSQDLTSTQSPAASSSGVTPANYQKQPPKADPVAKNQPEDNSYRYPDIKTAAETFREQQAKKNSGNNHFHDQPPPQKKRLGMHAVNAPYKSPVIQQPAPEAVEPMQVDDEDLIHPLLNGIDPKLIEQIKGEVLHNSHTTGWDDIAGLENVKQEIQEAVSLPLEHPWLFANGMLKLQKGILLYGPPGTGKTLIAKCVSAQCKATFFSISSSTLTSKWIGEGEKLVKALFAYAQVKQPSVIFIDEVDSILTKRGDNDHESSTRLKTEFMIQMDGASSSKEDHRVLVIGATNRPQKLDDAVIRRFSKRFFIPLPDLESRAQLISNLLRKEQHNLKAEDVLQIAQLTDGYSGADLGEVGSQAAIYRVREVLAQKQNIERSKLRRITTEDFLNSLKQVKATVSQDEIQQYIDWTKKVGSN